MLVELLVLLLLANGTPVLGARLLGERGAWPLDGGWVLADGRRLLGETKTVRGVLLAVATVTPAAMLFGHAWWIGTLFALASLTGDAVSSFFKRRLGIESSGRASGLDQVPEALLPLLVCYRLLDLTPFLVVLVVLLFTVGQMLISPLMFRLGIRHRPY
jgi:CDP-2,3-bis-(O-geranylgeranyl)-sn-glycerol synthase